MILIHKITGKRCAALFKAQCVCSIHFKRFLSSLNQLEYTAIFLKKHNYIDFPFIHSAMQSIRRWMRVNGAGGSRDSLDGGFIRINEVNSLFYFAKYQQKYIF